MKITKCLLFSTLIMLTMCGMAFGSGATFRISAVGAKLSQPNDENAEIPTYQLKTTVGQAITLVADGIVIPRGQGPMPGDIDAGAWLFDDEAFKLVPTAHAKGDKTKSVIMLEPLKAATKTRVRFVGDILGRYQKFDVIVEVAEK